MGTITVRPDDLRSAIDQATQAGEVLEGLRADTLDLARRMLADPQLDRYVGLDHIDAFCERWRREFELLQDLVLGMNQLLGRAAQCYDDLDTGLAGQMPAAGPVPSPDAIDRRP